MNPEEKIFEKYITNYQKKLVSKEGLENIAKAIHEAYEAGGLAQEKEDVASFHIIETKTAQAIFEELEEIHVGFPECKHYAETYDVFPKSCCSFNCLVEYRALKDKYLKANPEEGSTTGKFNEKTGLFE